MDWIYTSYINFALQKKGYRIPEDISIVGFDNCIEASMQNPPITTIDAHPEIIGNIAAQRLLERIANPRQLHKITVVQSDIIYRSSADL